MRSNRLYLVLGLLIVKDLLMSSVVLPAARTVLARILCYVNESLTGLLEHVRRVVSKASIVFLRKC